MLKKLLPPLVITILLFGFAWIIKPKLKETDDKVFFENEIRPDSLDDIRHISKIKLDKLKFLLDEIDVKNIKIDELEDDLNIKTQLSLKDFEIIFLNRKPFDEFIKIKNNPIKLYRNKQENSIGFQAEILKNEQEEKFVVLPNDVLMSLVQRRNAILN